MNSVNKIAPFGAALALALALAASAAVAAPDDLTPAVKQACRTDYKKYCIGSRLRPGGAVKCMREHAALLSDTCKVAWADSHPPDEATPADNLRGH
jgi:hypothetical protein